MARKKWRGDAQGIAQVDTITVGGTYANGQVYTATMNGKDVAYTGVSGDDNTAVAVALLAALNATSIPEFRQCTYTRNALVITVTGPSNGEPFTLTSAATGTGTLVRAGVTTGTGPNYWSNAENWSDGVVPVSTDTVDIENSAVDILYGIDQNAVTLTALYIAASYTGKIGLPNTHLKGYYEYREKFLKISATTCTIGEGDGSGSNRIKLNLGSNASAITVYKTGRGQETGIPALLLKNVHASSTLNAMFGSIGLAFEGGDVSTIPTIRVGSTSSISDVSLTCGSGCTLTTIQQSGGTVIIACNLTTWTKSGGISRQTGSATLTTLTQDGNGTGAPVHQWWSSGTLTTATVRGPGSVLDCQSDNRSRTLTNGTFTGGGHILDPHKTVTFTNPITIDSIGTKLSNLGNSPSSLQRT